jgi:hypothetical protein
MLLFTHQEVLEKLLEVHGFKFLSARLCSFKVRLQDQLHCANRVKPQPALLSSLYGLVELHQILAIVRFQYFRGARESKGGVPPPPFLYSPARLQNRIIKFTQLKRLTLTF